MTLFDSMVVHGLPLVPKFVVGRVARRYVAGTTREDAMATIRRLNAEGAMCTVDVLGEEVTEREKTEAAVQEYLELLGDIERAGVDSNISIKLTLLGLRIDEGFCHDNVVRVVERAKELGNFVRIDMEDHTCTDMTLRIYAELAKKFGNVGTVLQAYLRRTPADIDDLMPLGPNIRLCKGIYREPRAIAWHAYETVRANYRFCLRKLLEGGAYTGIATHDEHLVWAGMSEVNRLGLEPDQYEFQMLLGVDPELRRIILDHGHRLRVYVPYGRDWYPYSVRRLRENPTVAKHVMRAMLGLPARP